jgi:crossover junction endodeoxyribonuclease RusA
MTTEIRLPFPPSTNNLFVNNPRGGRFISAKYREWIALAGAELQAQRPVKMAGPVSLVFRFEAPTNKRPRDISNLLKAPEDLLVKHGIIEGDSHLIVRRISAEWSAEVIGVHIQIFHLHSMSIVY